MAASAPVRRVFRRLLAANLAVVGAKLAVGLASGSLAILGSALDSAVDALNNVLALVVVGVAAKEPDENHPYGHEKFETLGALAIVGFLSISCFELLRQGVRHLLGGDVPHPPSLVELVLIGSTMGVNLFVVWYERRRGERLQSAFLMADAAHTRSDIYLTAAALGSLVLTRMGLGFIDPLLAIAVALVIAWNGYEIVRGTVPVLVDERGVDAARVRRLVSAIPEVVDVRTVRS